MIFFPNYNQALNVHLNSELQCVGGWFYLPPAPTGPKWVRIWVPVWERSICVRTVLQGTGTGRSQLEFSCTDITSQPHLNTELANCFFPRKRHHWDLWNHRTNTGRAEGGAKGSIKSKPCSRGSKSLLLTSWSLLIWPVVGSNPRNCRGTNPGDGTGAPLAALTHSLFTSRASRDAKQGTARLSSALSTFKPFLQGSRAPRNLL